MSRTKQQARMLAAALKTPAPQALTNADMPEWTPTLTLDRQVTAARREMGEARWRELMDEWESTP